MMDKEIIKQKALQLVNRIRREVGLPEIDELKKGRVANGANCPVARSIKFGWADLDQVGVSLGEVRLNLWGTNQNETVLEKMKAAGFNAFIQDRAGTWGPQVYIYLDDSDEEVNVFMVMFDDGEYPELIGG